ncbi:MAG: hypothetical protein ACFHXK_09435 [bacterium]
MTILGEGGFAELFRLTLFSAHAVVLFVLGVGPVWGSTNPLTRWGDPNIEGVWDFRTITPFQRPEQFGDKAVLTPEEARAFQAVVLQRLDVDNRADDESVDIEGAYNNAWYDWGTELTGDLRTSLIVDPPNGRLPALTTTAEKQLLEHNSKRMPPVRDMFSYSADPTTFRPAGPESLGLSERCLAGFNAGPPLIPSAYNNNLRIVQTPDHVLLVTEMIHNARVVPLDGRPFLPAELKLWSGIARGHWDSDTLVVQTKNFSDRTAIFQKPANSIADAIGSGAVGSSKDFMLTERFTRQGETLIYSYTIDAPEVFTKPFTVEIPMRRSAARMYEYACHEGNYALPGILRGARLLEAEAYSSLQR